MRSLLCAIMLFPPFALTAFAIDGDRQMDEYQINAFRNVKAEGSNGNYLVRGEARPLEGTFYFSVEDGHVEYIKEKQVFMKDKDLNWEPIQIQIQIPKETLPDNGTLLINLYERNREGRIMNSYPIILQRFK
ncbi:intracellular proteinase inhibitor [Neobacillus pocheonensis]|uniref:Intracellular proteinase inhibitor n=1 Tax=Neobacillus pocheonensis TaxID=363869 RepID=A0ABT0WBM5_9BACI|nr:intracellular proteinase inhibitor [Neobacillus pocheonensis]